jgi:hypothetical protein
MMATERGGSSDHRSPILDAALALEIGSAKRTPAPSNFDAELGNRMMQSLAKRLTSSEMSTLLEATRVREQGLRLCRAGDLAQGAELVQAAAFAHPSSHLTREARATSESFDYAALAYVAYKMHDYDSAANDLLKALAACRLLGDEYGHDVEARRIHLVRNLIRVKIASGDYPTGLVLINCMLMRLELGADCWPISDSMRTRPCAPSAAERQILADQILSELCALLDRDGDQAAQTLALLDRRLYRYKGDRGVSRVGVWLTALVAHEAGDTLGFLQAAGAFFIDGPEHLISAWDALHIRFIRVWVDHASA